jgi:hypothetical protein
MPTLTTSCLPRQDAFIFPRLPCFICSGKRDGSIIGTSCLPEDLLPGKDTVQFLVVAQARGRQPVHNVRMACTTTIMYCTCKFSASTTKIEDINLTILDSNSEFLRQIYLFIVL